MVDSSTRLRGSAAASMGAHGALLGAYLLLRTTTAQNGPVLTHIEFMDMKPAPVEAPAAEPARRAPRDLKDFLRMALPQFRPAPAAPQEPLEAPREQARTLQDVRVAPSLKLDSRTLEREQAVRLDGPRLSRAQASASMSDVAADAGPRRATDVDPKDVKPDIQLEAVGRRAVRGAPSPSISIDPNARVTRTASMGDVATLRGAAPAAAGTGAGQPGIRLVDDAPVRTGRAAPPAIGYGRGSGGGGLSLQDRPVERPRAVKIPEERPRAQAREEHPLAAKKTKAFELTGPLANRKLLSAALPPYPAWAAEKGVEAEVSIRFFVSPEGRVLERMLVERTSGYDDLDRLCQDALKTWTFVALPGEEGEQWGIVTFKFRLK